MYVQSESRERSSGILEGRAGIHLWFQHDDSDTVSCPYKDPCEDMKVELVGKMTYLDQSYDTLRPESVVGSLDVNTRYLFDETFFVQSDSLVVRVLLSKRKGVVEKRTVYRFAAP